MCEIVCKGENDVTLREYQLLADMLIAVPGLLSARIYGSRARGEHRYNSDIDVAIEVSGNALDAVTKVYQGYYDLPIPHQLDVVPIQWIDSIEMLEHVKRDGISIVRDGKVVSPQPR